MSDIDDDDFSTSSNTTSSSSNSSTSSNNNFKGGLSKFTENKNVFTIKTDNEDNIVENDLDLDNNDDIENDEILSIYDEEEDANISDDDDDDDIIDENNIVEDENNQHGGATTKSKKIINKIELNDDIDDVGNNFDDDDDDNDDETYLQRFNSEINKNYIMNYHPECLNHNYDEISALSKVTRDEFNIIIDPLHKTVPYLTKYERARILGQRAKQIECGSKPFVKVPENIIESHIIAELELQEKKIPFIIRRPLPNGGSEYWNLKDLEIISF
jgi:DNA-directed RNA polymerase I, II, and III subunit RPABC2